MTHPALLAGSLIETICPAGHRSWLASESVTLACMTCHAPAVRTGRVKPPELAVSELCGGRLPQLPGSGSVRGIDPRRGYRLNTPFKLD